MSKDIDRKFEEAKQELLSHIAGKNKHFSKDVLITYNNLFSNSSMDTKKSYCGLLAFAALRAQSEEDKLVYQAGSQEFRKTCKPLFDKVESFKAQIEEYGREFKSAPGF